jgi:hypothetical protein
LPFAVGGVEAVDFALQFAGGFLLFGVGFLPGGQAFAQFFQPRAGRFPFGARCVRSRWQRRFPAGP